MIKQRIDRNLFVHHAEEKLVSAAMLEKYKTPERANEFAEIRLLGDKLNTKNKELNPNCNVLSTRRLRPVAVGKIQDTKNRLNYL